MAGKQALTIIKPDAVGNALAGAILKQIQEAGFRIVAVKLTYLSKEQAGQFYAVHKQRPF